MATATILVRDLVGLLIACLVVCGFSDARAGEQEKSARVIGELRSRKNTPDGKNTFIEVLAPGEERARSYHVLYDPKINGPIELVLAAVRAAKIGDVVEFKWVQTGHGPAINSFRVFKKGTGHDRIRELLQERLATLKELATVTRSAYMQGKATFGEVTQSSARLIKAELELCESDKERIVVHEKAVALAKEYEHTTAKLFASGLATQAAVLATRTNRLDAEIALEQMKAKATAAAK
jgi:hypothetical protein